MKEVELRDLNLLDLENPTFFDTIATLSPCKLSLEQLSTVYYNRQHTGIRTMVLVVNDEIVGTGSIILENKFIHNGGKVAHIEDVAVHPDFQHNGLGTKIVNFLINIAIDGGCYKVILNCAPKTVAFYEELGFKKHEYEMRLDLRSDNGV